MKKIYLLFGVMLVLTRLSAQDNSKFISQTVPSSVTIGQQFQMSITFENTGTTIWKSSDLIRLGAINRTEEWVSDGTNRIHLSSNITPGMQVTFTTNMIAIENGNALQWQMVHDGVAWFGETSEIKPITIIRDSALDSLIVKGSSFSVNSHVVGTYLFHWFTSDGGQISGPWIPIEGRENWTGEVDYWKRMVKQIMAANIDVLYLTMMPIAEQQRINLFKALYQLRQEGWEVPKVCPFLDTRVTYTVLGYRGDTGTETGKDEFVHHYVKFYQQYFSQNPDSKADSYIYTQDDKPVLDVYALNDVDNIEQLKRDDITNRLKVEFGLKYPIFNNDIKMIGNYNGETFTFVDEKVAQFSAPGKYYYRSWKGNIRNVMVKPGTWDQNIKYPGLFLPRDGGSHYIKAWEDMQEPGDVLRVFVETFNEYDQGSGIFAAKTDEVYKVDSNTSNDTWSANDDPYEYIKITANGASIFNDYQNQDAKIIWHNIPTTMKAGEVFNAKVIVRNTGNEQWNNANNYRFGQQDSDDEIFGYRGFIDDDQNEISTYGGIFKGRAITFYIKITAPNSIGNYSTHWSMLQEGVTWFGDILEVPITVIEGTLNNEDYKKVRYSVYPNPVLSNESINIDGFFSIDDRVEITDAMGKIIYSYFLLENTNSIMIDTREIMPPVGIYFLRIFNANGVEVYKIIRE